MTKAFTLAEVLIILAIIGVVAAMTIPTLIANHQKKVAVTLLAKFYSAFNQAIAMKNVDNEEWDTSGLTAVNDPDAMLNFYNANYAPYLKTVGVQKTSKGIAVALSYGSGVYFRKSQSVDNPGGSFGILC